MAQLSNSIILKRLNRLLEISIALSAERDNIRLLELILLGAKELTGADGGSLYSVEEGKFLRFKIFQNDSLDLHFGGTSEVEVEFPEIPLYLDNGEANEHMVAAYCVIHDKIINIPDAYEAPNFDFSGTKTFDESTGYRSMSFLTMPLKDHENEIMGVIQIINAQNPETGDIQAFTREDEVLVHALASLTAVTWTNQKLIKGRNEMLEAFVRSLADAIDEKSKFTGQHCRRVPILSKLIAEAINETREGKLAERNFSEKEIYELSLASWLHDCGKLTIPVHLVEKRTKLEGINDKIHLLDSRFELCKAQEKIAALQEKLKEAGIEYNQEGDDVLTEKLNSLEGDLRFLHECNISKEEGFSEDDTRRVEEIAKRQYQGPGEKLKNILSDDEVENLCIKRGNLNKDEYAIVKKHVVNTAKMLGKLPYPKDLRLIPEIASTHHERLDGTGYPNGLKGEEIIFQARILAIADIFEAITAPDRPYNKGMKLSQAVAILEKKAKDGKIDPDIYDVFMQEKIYYKYGHIHLNEEQVDIR